MQLCKMTPLGARFLLLCCSLLCLLLDHLSSGDVTASVGSDVTLLCNYNSVVNGRLPACWSRGPLPMRGCSNEVIKSNGGSVVSRQSERYLLLGDLAGGDVSLTIRQVEEGDSGIYGCRVEIPGWFNDHKHEQKLTVVAVPPSPMKVEVREVKERTAAVHWSPVFNGGRRVTRYTLDLKNKQAAWNTAVVTELHDPALNHITLLGLLPAKTYNVRMFAMNSIGRSDSSNVLTITTKEAVPEGPPQDLKLEALSPRSIRVTWKPPKAELRNGVLRIYTVSYRTTNQGSRQASPLMHKSVPATREEESLILTNLVPSTEYSVLIRATTNAGAGPYAPALCSTLDEVLTTTEVETLDFFASTESTWYITVPGFTTAAPEPDTTSATMSEQRTTSVAAGSMTTAPEPDTTSATMSEQRTPSVAAGSMTTAPETDSTSTTTVLVEVESTASIVAVPPDPPLLQLDEATYNSVSLFWVPGLGGDSPITGFVLKYKTENASWDSATDSIEFSPDQTDATLVEFHPSTYHFRMFAKNRHGVSKPSNVLTITTEQTGHEKDSRAAVAVEGSHIYHVAAVIPVVLVVLLVAAVIIWRCRQVKYKQGQLTLWMSNRSERLTSSESLQEL